MRFRLRTLLIVLALAPPVLEGPAKGIAMFRFTIRDVLWLTVVAGVALAMAIGWRQEYYRSTSRQLECRARAMQQVLERDGYRIEERGPHRVIIIGNGSSQFADDHIGMREAARQRDAVRQRQSEPSR